MQLQDQQPGSWLQDQKPGSWLQCILCPLRPETWLLLLKKWNPFKLDPGVWYTTTLAKIERFPCKLSHGAGSLLLDYTTMQLLSRRLRGKCFNQTSDLSAIFVIQKDGHAILKTVQCPQIYSLFLVIQETFEEKISKTNWDQKVSVSVHPAQGAPPHLPGRRHSPVCTHQPT